MTVSTRTVPLDHLSVREGSRYISISTHWQDIFLHLQGDDGADGRSFTFDQFYAALQGLLKPEAGPPPSSDDKTPTAASQTAEKGTLEAKP